MKKNSIFISFFNSNPITSGASAVTTNFFLSWPGRKKLFQLNHEKNKFNKNIYNFYLFSNKFYLKILYLIPYTLFILYKIRKKKIDYIVFEGASWTGYIFICFLIIKFFKKKSKFIYHSHNVDYEFRRNNFFISKLSFYFENKILEKFDISTCVSKKDQLVFKKKFRKKVQIFPNGLIFNKKFLQKTITGKYILFSGSLIFIENRKTFESLLNNEFNILKEFIPDIKIYHTGGGKTKYYENLKHVKELGNLSMKKYLNFLQKALLIVIPAHDSPGTKVKVIEALGYNKILLTTKHGIKGINSKYDKFLLYNNLKEFKKKIKYLKKHKFQKKIYRKIGLHYRNLYDMRNITQKFYDKNLF